MDCTFGAVVFDWDGTAVPDRQADATDVRRLVEALCASGVDVFVVSGTHVGNVDPQLAARPTGPGKLFLCLNRGSEVFSVDADGARLIASRIATADEEAALDRAATLCVEELRGLGVEAAVVSKRVNRRKIDIIPDPLWADPPKARIDELLAAVLARLHAAGIDNLTRVVDIAFRAARASGIGDPRITSDVKHVEIGLTDKSDSASWAATWLATKGVTGNLILIAGDEFGPIGGVPGSDSLMVIPELARAVTMSVGVEPGGVPAEVIHAPGGPGRFLEELEGQLTRRRQRRVPSIDHDPRWVVTLPHQAHLQRAAESIGSLVNGFTGTRAAREEDGRGTLPLFVVDGMYTGSGQQLLAGPSWDALGIRSDRRGDRRYLDLRTGVLLRSGSKSGLRTLRFASATHPHALALRAELAPSDWVKRPLERDVDTAITLRSEGGGIAVGWRDRLGSTAEKQTVERLASWTAEHSRAPSADDVRRGLDEVDRLGYDALLAAQRAEWASRWRDAEICIEGSPTDELAARFAVFHLLAASVDKGEASVGARGLTGSAYGGHVFWDADVFVLPVLAAIRPAAARAMLQYRVNRLPAAREAAARQGLAGARFPWESASDGFDVTPRESTRPDGMCVPILTGDHEEHIVADVAWAVATYVAWSGDTEFLDGNGRELVFDTARYWASRARVGPDGRAHIDGVIGPDEYHELVDDNAFTNVMAQWNLRYAASVADRSPTMAAEAAEWRQLADALVDGYDASTRRYEQFAGYFGLEPILVESIGKPPLAADVILGRERTAGSQVIKQADVLMLHHMVPDSVHSDSLGPNIAYYLPRTAHGSSLSPAICAALLARSGRPDEALQLFRLAARLDLDDVGGTTAGGLHVATLGGVWQALVSGFLGLRPTPDGLRVDPCLPSEWTALSVRLRFRGQRLAVRATHTSVEVSCETALPVYLGDVRSVCAPPGDTFQLGRRPS